MGQFYCPVESPVVPLSTGVYILYSKYKVTNSIKQHNGFLQAAVWPNKLFAFLPTLAFEHVLATGTILAYS